MTKTAHVDTFAADRLPDRETWPDFTFNDEVPKYPDYLNAAEELLQSGYDDRPAIHMGDVTWTYRDLDQKSNQIASVLKEHFGMVPGNRVLLRGNNTPMLAALWYAVLKAGGVVITTMTMLRQKELDAGGTLDFPTNTLKLLNEGCNFPKNVLLFSQILRVNRAHFR